MATISDAEREATLAEYSALRAEILALAQGRNQFLIYDLTGFVFFFGLAVNIDKAFFLVAPLIHYPFMLYWSYAERQIIKIGHYIKHKIEPRVGSMGWENKIFGERYELAKDTTFPVLKNYIPTWNMGKLTHTELSAVATFAGSTVICLLLWVSEATTSGKSPKFNLLTIIILLILDITVIFYSYFLVRKSSYDINKYAEEDSNFSI